MGKKKAGAVSKRSGPPGAGSRDMFRAIADAAPVMIWMSDARGRISYVNAPWLAFTGGTPAHSIGDGWTERIHREDRRSFHETYQSALAARQPFKAELRLQRSDGEFRWVVLSGLPRQSGRRFLGYVGSAADVTERRRGEVALRESEARYKRLSDSIGDVFFAVNAEMRCTYWNRASETMTGRSATEALGIPLTDLFPASAGELGSFLGNVLLENTADSTTCVVRDANRQRMLEVFAYPWNEGVSVIMKDMTRRLEAETELRRSEQKYRTVFESANDAILIFDPETEIIHEANPRACELYAKTREALIGTSLKSMTRDVSRGEAQIRKAIDTGTYTNFDTVHFRSDGLPLYLTVNASAIDYQGRTAILSIHRDVSHTRVAQEKFTRALALQESILEGARDAFCVAGTDGRILIVNGAAQRMTGLARQDLIGTPVDGIFDGGQREKAAQLLTSACEGGEEQWEGSLERADGVQIPVDITFRGIDLADLRYVQVTMRDITERKRSEEALRAGEERYRQFLEATSDGIWRVELGEGIPAGLPEEEQIERLYTLGFVAECSGALARMAGVVSTSSLVGSALGDEVLRRGPHTESILRSFIRASYRIADAAVRAVRADGDVRHYLLTLVGTVDNGRLVRMWGNLRDVTARMRSERELRLLAQTITSTKDCVSITDLNDIVLYVNDAFLKTYGYAEDELIGMPVDVLRAPGVPPDVAEAIRPSTMNGGWNGEILNRRKDGTVFPIELWTSVVRNDEGEPVALVGVARDITERRLAEEQIRASLREKEVLLKEVHHRVKNNLQIISSLLNLQSEYIHDPEMLRVFSESQNRVKSMALVHEKLYRSTNLAEIDFGDYVRELSAQLVRSYGMSLRGVELRVNAESIALGIDRAIPCGIIVNELVSNALKYGFPNGNGGTVYVDVQSGPEQTLQLVVGDTGVGLPPGFDLDAVETLGLKLVRMLTFQLQGELVLEHSAVRLGGNTGTEYTITVKQA